MVVDCFAVGEEVLAELVAAGTVGRHGVFTPGDSEVARAVQGRRPATDVLKAAERV